MCWQIEVIGVGGNRLKPLRNEKDDYRDDQKR